jgi:TolB protein
MDDGGGSRVTYPAPPVAFGFPAWSPDGSQIAVVGTGADDSAIYVFDVPKPGSGTVPAIGPEPVVIYRSAERLPFYLYWRPDGRHVGFLAGEPVGISLRVAPADGSGPLDGGGTAAAIRRGQPLYFDWVDARRLLVHVNLGSDAFTGEVGLDGAPLEPSLDGSGLFRSASLSRDGSWVAYVSSAGDGSQKLVVASRPGPGSHETEVFGPTAFVFDPAGDALAWIASDEPVGPEAGLPIGPLRLTDPTTGAVRTLLDRPVVGFFWSPDGRTIATILPSQPGDDVVNPGTGGVSGAAAIAVRRAVSPVGQAGGVLARLAFVDVSTGATRSERVVRLAEGFVNQLLPYFDQYALSHRVWAPDSAALLLPLVDAIAGYQLVAVSPDGAEPKPVADGMRGFWSP